MYAGAAWAMAFGWADFFTVFIGAIVVGVILGFLGRKLFG